MAAAAYPVSAGGHVVVVQAEAPSGPDGHPWKARFRPRSPVGPGAARKFVPGKVAATVSAQPRAGRRFATMAKIESKHEVRRKVREAQAQANRERLKRESDNREDMVAFLVAEQKLAAVDEWESDRHEQVRLEADQRREEQRLEGARALARMRDRGESVASIAQIGGCSEKLVRIYLKELRGSAAPSAGPDSGNGSQALGFENGTSAKGASQALGAHGPSDAAAPAASASVGVGVDE